VTIYIAYTLAITEWRITFRRRMNQSDSEANTKAIDSLINYETVKYFGNEEHEARRFDEALQRYERAAVISQTSLSLLNIGQATIISVGLTAIMYMAGCGKLRRLHRNRPHRTRGRTNPIARLDRRHSMPNLPPRGGSGMR